MDSLPLLSVVIPTYNRGAALTPLLESLARQANPDDDLLVIDDGSSDNTSGVVSANPRFRLQRNVKNLGMVGNWNACLQAARHEWICIVHDDDVLVANGLATLRRACALSPGPKLIAHRLEGADFDPAFRYRVWEPGPWSVLHIPEIPSGAVVHRQIIEKLGTFDPRFRYSTDLEYFARIAAVYPLVIIESPAVIHYQLHGENYQFETWQKHDFYPQFEDLQRTIVRYSGVTDETREQEMVDQRMAWALMHIFRTASAWGKHDTARHACRLLLQRRNFLGRRQLFGLRYGALTGREFRPGPELSISSPST